MVPGEPGAATGDFRGYRTTFLAFLALARVLEAGSGISRFEHAAPVGTDFEAGEIEPVDGPGIAGAFEEDPLARLEEEPAAALKALNRREVALVRLPVTESEGVRRLPRSYLRAECFGRVQNRISQALRSKAGPAELRKAVAAAPEPGYPAQVEALEQAEAHLRRVAKACLYVLHRIARGDGEDAGGDDDQERDEGAPLQIDFRLLGEARKAFEGLNRAGFGRAALSDPRLAPAYRAVAEMPARRRRAPRGGAPRPPGHGLGGSRGRRPAGVRVGIRPALPNRPGSSSSGPARRQRRPGRSDAAARANSRGSHAIRTEDSMSKRWSDRSPAERRKLEAAFIGLHGAQLLLDPESTPWSEAGLHAPRRPAQRQGSFARIYAALLGGGPLPADISAALGADPALRDDCDLLLRRSAWRRLPRAAAAAGRDPLERREGDGFVLRLVASRAARDQVYLLIELSGEASPGADAPPPQPADDETPVEPASVVGPEDLAEADGPSRGPGSDATPGPPPTRPARIVVKTAQGEYLKCELSPPDARTIRLVMTADDPLVRALAEPSSEVFLL